MLKMTPPTPSNVKTATDSTASASQYHIADEVGENQMEKKTVNKICSVEAIDVS